MRIAQIPQDKLVCGSRGILMMLDVYPSDPVAPSSQILDKMATDKSPGSADQRFLHFFPFVRSVPREAQLN